MNSENGSIIEAVKLSKRDGDRVLFEGGTFRIRRWDRIQVTGERPTAISAMMSILAGVDSEYEGELKVHAPHSRIGYLAAAPELPPGEDIGEVIDNLLAPTRELRARYSAAMEALHEDSSSDELEQLTLLADSLGSYDLESDVCLQLKLLELPSKSTRVADLAPVERKRLALALLLARRCEVYVLDDLQLELSESALDRLSRWIAETPGTWLMAVPGGSLLSQKQNGLVSHLAPKQIVVADRVTFSGSPSIRGQAVDAEGRPLKSWLVVATPTPGSILPPRMSLTTRSGHFDLRFPAVGECRIELQSPKRVFANSVDEWWLRRKASCVLERVWTGSHDLRLTRS